MQFSEKKLQFMTAAITVPNKYGTNILWKINILVSKRNFTLYFGKKKLRYFRQKYGGDSNVQD